MIKAPPWYSRLEAALEPSWPLMIAIALVIILITVLLLSRGKRVPLAAWLVYLISP